MRTSATPAQPGWRPAQTRSPAISSIALHRLRGGANDDDDMLSRGTGKSRRQPSPNTSQRKVAPRTSAPQPASPGLDAHMAGMHVAGNAQGPGADAADAGPAEHDASMTDAEASDVDSEGAPARPQQQPPSRNPPVDDCTAAEHAAGLTATVADRIPANRLTWDAHAALIRQAHRVALRESKRPATAHYLTQTPSSICDDMSAASIGGMFCLLETCGFAAADNLPNPLPQQAYDMSTETGRHIADIGRRHLSRVAALPPDQFHVAVPASLNAASGQKAAFIVFFVAFKRGSGAHGEQPLHSLRTLCALFQVHGACLRRPDGAVLTGPQANDLNHTPAALRQPSLITADKELQPHAVPAFWLGIDPSAHAAAFRHTAMAHVSPADFSDLMPELVPPLERGVHTVALQRAALAQALCNLPEDAAEYRTADDIVACRVLELQCAQLIVHPDEQHPHAYELTITTPRELQHMLLLDHEIMFSMSFVEVQTATGETAVKKAGYHILLNIPLQPLQAVLSTYPGSVTVALQWTYGKGPKASEALARAPGLTASSGERGLRPQYAQDLIVHDFVSELTVTTTGTIGAACAPPQVVLPPGMGGSGLHMVPASPSMPWRNKGLIVLSQRGPVAALPMLHGTKAAGLRTLTTQRGASGATIQAALLPLPPQDPKGTRGLQWVKNFPTALGGTPLQVCTSLSAATTAIVKHHKAVPSQQQFSLTRDLTRGLIQTMQPIGGASSCTPLSAARKARGAQVSVNSNLQAAFGAPAPARQPSAERTPAPGDAGRSTDPEQHADSAATAHVAPAGTKTPQDARPAHTAPQ